MKEEIKCCSCEEVIENPCDEYIVEYNWKPICGMCATSIHRATEEDRHKFE